MCLDRQGQKSTALKIHFFINSLEDKKFFRREYSIVGYTYYVVFNDLLFFVTPRCLCKTDPCMNCEMK